MTLFLLFLLFLSALCFIVSALSRGKYDTRVSLVPLGLFFWVTTIFIQAVQAFE